MIYADFKEQANSKKWQLWLKTIKSNSSYCKKYPIFLLIKNYW